jgi:AcrR family transcriptional regulator
MIPQEVEQPGRQALKTQRTRQRLIGATISLIKEGGFAAASSSRIAKRAKITWGAAQHHFGTKEEILGAVLEQAYDKFIETMNAPELRTGSMADRVGHFVDRMWMHYQTDVYLVALEILLATRADRRHPVRAWEERHDTAHLKIVREIFYDSKLSHAKLSDILNFTHCCLTGLSIEGAFESDVRAVKGHLQRLKTTLLISLSGM